MNKVLFSGFLLVMMLMVQYANSQEPAPDYVKMLEKQPAFQHYFKDLPPYFLADKNKFDKINAVSFVIIDSLANAFSFYSNEQQPISYSVSQKTLVMIKRGASGDATQLNSLNNIFFRTSADWGKTWTNPVLLYDYRNAQVKNRMARYPSIYGFEYDGSTAFVYTTPVTDGSTTEGWQGVINGLYTKGEVYNSLTEKFKGAKDSYKWGTNAKILARSIGDNDLYAIAFGSVSPVTLGTTDNSNLAYRRTEQFDDWGGTIPDAWSSGRFFDVDRSDYRRSGIISMKYGSNNRIYASAFGGFQVTKDVDSANTVGVSTSDDEGKTWSEFDVCPHSLIKEHAQNEGFNTEKMYIPWDGKDMVVFDNGDFSIGVSLIDYDTSVAIANRKSQFVEIYRESGVWGVRKIANHGGYTLAYINEDNVLDTINQMGYEFQMIRSVDGNNVVAKWVDFIDIYDEAGDSLIKNATTDIMVSVRENNVSKKNWGKTINVTQDIPFDRITWLPDYVPNDLKQVPVMRLQTIPVGGETPANARLTERKIYMPQFVTLGHFDASLSVGVKEQDIVNTEMKISPNPAGEKFSLTFTLPEQGNIRIKIYNTNGICVKEVYNGFVGEGLRGLEINTDNLVNGVYYCTMEYMGSVQKCNLIICK